MLEYCCLFGRKHDLPDNVDPRLFRVTLEDNSSSNETTGDDNDEKQNFSTTTTTSDEIEHNKREIQKREDERFKASPRTCAWCSALLELTASPKERLVGFGSYGSKLRLCNDACWRNWLTRSPEGK